MTFPAKVEVRGLRELNAAFKRIDSKLPAELRDHMKSIAEHVVDKARGKMEFGPGAASNSVRPRGSQRGAGIAFPGGETTTGTAPYYPWLDFGGSTGKGHKIGSGGSGSVKRSMPKGGRYIYPAIAESTEYIETNVLAAVELIAESEGFEVDG